MKEFISFTPSLFYRLQVSHTIILELNDLCISYSLATKCDLLHYLGLNWRNCNLFQRWRETLHWTWWESFECGGSRYFLCPNQDSWAGKEDTFQNCVGTKGIMLDCPCQTGASLCVPCPGRTQWEDDRLLTWKRVFARSRICWHIARELSLGIMRNQCPLFKPLRLFWFWL